MGIKLGRMQVENFKIIKLLDIEITDNMIEFAGANGSGKSTALEAFAAALMGKRNIDDDPIREGEEKGKIVQEFNKYLVERTFKRKDDGDAYTTQLKVTDRSGEAISRPQTVLNNLISDIGLRPRKFAETDSNTRMDMLLEVVDLDFSNEELEFFLNGREPAEGDNPIEILDNTYDEIYTERRDVGRDKRKAKESLKNYEDIEQVEEVNVTELVQRRDKLKDRNQDILEIKDNLDDKEDDIETTDQEINEVKEEIKRLQEKLADLEETKEEQVEQVEQYRKDLEGLRPEYKQNQKVIKDLDEKIKNANETNQKAQKYKDKLKHKEEFEKYDSEYNILSDMLDDIEEYKEKLIAQAGFPLDNLSFQNGKVYYQGHPFEQASQTEKLEVGFAILKELNPELKVVLIENGNTIDDKHMEFLKELAEQDDYVVLMENLNPDEDTGIILENGEVVDNKYEDIADEEDPFVEMEDTA